MSKSEKEMESKMNHMSFAEQVSAAKNQSHWTVKQRNHLRRLIKKGATIAYWLSDAHGRPSNNVQDHMKAKNWTAYPGLVQVVKGPLELCTENALHGTFEPHKWAGCRVWLCGFIGPIDSKENKIGSLHREIIGEIMPEEALTPSIGIKVGRKDLRSSDLNHANLTYANLSNADLSHSDLSNASLVSADLYCANLSNADLRRTNLSNADLRGAILSNANVSHSNLRGARLDCANLRSADLRYASLYSANLHSATLSNANLSHSNLSNANLSNANLSNANLSHANLSHSNLSNVDLSYTDFSNVDLSYANLHRADLSYTNFSNVDLSFARWNHNYPPPSGWTFHESRLVKK